MLYEVEQAPHEIALLTTAIRQRRQPPDKILNRPELLPGLDYYWDAFWQLATCRAWPGALIPWTAIQHWAEVDGLDPERTKDLHDYVRVLDMAFLKWKSDNAPKGEPEPRSLAEARRGRVTTGGHPGTIRG